MTVRDHSFRIGKLDSDQGTPSLANLSKQIEIGIYGEVGRRRGARAVSYHEEHELFFIKFVKETSTEIIMLDEENEDTEQEVYPRRVMKFILSSNGNFLYESVQGVTAGEAVQYLSENIEKELEIEQFEDVPRRTMLDFADNHLDRVKKFKVENIGEYEPNPIPVPSRIREILDEFGKVIDNNEGSVGHDPDADATENELSGGLIVTSDPHIIRGEDQDERIEELNSSGIYRTRYDDEDMRAEDEAFYVMNKVDSVFGDLFDTSTDSSDGNQHNNNPDSSDSSGGNS